MKKLKKFRTRRIVKNLQCAYLWQNQPFDKSEQEDKDWNKNIEFANWCLDLK